MSLLVFKIPNNKCPSNTQKSGVDPLKKIRSIRATVHVIKLKVILFFFLMFYEEIKGKAGKQK